MHVVAMRQEGGKPKVDRFIIVVFYGKKKLRTYSLESGGNIARRIGDETALDKESFILIHLRYQTSCV